MTKQFSNYSDLLTFTRASKGHALRPVSYGNELVTNGSFFSDTSGWTAGNNAGLSIHKQFASWPKLSLITLWRRTVRVNQAISYEAGKIYA